MTRRGALVAAGAALVSACGRNAAPLGFDEYLAQSVVGAAIVDKTGCTARVDRVGTERLGAAAKFTENTIIPIGSVSKTITAAIVTSLEMHGRLRGTDSVRRFVPELVAERDVTIEDLLRQRTTLVDYNDPGFLSELGLSGDLDAAAARRRVLAALGRERVRRGPFRYSNSNYFVLGAIAERAANAPYEMLVARLDLRPQPGRLSAPTAPLPESYVPDVGAFRPSPREDPRLMSAAGGVRSSAATLVNLWSALFGSAGSLRAVGDAMTKPAGDDDKKERYGRGVFVSRGARGEAVWHGGLVDGFSSYAEYRRSHDRVGVILTNTRLDSIELDSARILGLAGSSPASQWCAR